MSNKSPTLLCVALLRVQMLPLSQTTRSAPTWLLPHSCIVLAHRCTGFSIWFQITAALTLPTLAPTELSPARSLTATPAAAARVAAVALLPLKQAVLVMLGYLARSTPPVPGFGDLVLLALLAVRAICKVGLRCARLAATNRSRVCCSCPAYSMLHLLWRWRVRVLVGGTRRLCVTGMPGSVCALA